MIFKSRIWTENSIQQHRLWSKGLEGSLGGTGIRPWWTTDWAVSAVCPHSKERWPHPGSKHDSRLREGILYLSLSLEHCVQFGAHDTRGTLSYQSGQRVTVDWSTGCVRRVQELGLIKMEKGKLRKRNPYFAAWWEHIKNVDQHFLQKCPPQGNRNKLKCGKSWANVRK